MIREFIKPDELSSLTSANPHCTMTHEPSATFLEDLASTKSRPKTPPGPPHALSGDSPTKHPSVHSDQFRGNAAVEDKRDAIMKDVCAHQAGIDNFINALLPALHKDIKLERVLNALDQDSGLPWSGLEGRSQLNENDLYRSIGTFFCRIVELAKEMSESEPPLQTFTYGSQPNTKPSVADRLTSNKPDGFIKLITDEDKLYKDWYSYALAAEYKLSSTKEKELNMDSPITAIQFDVCVSFCVKNNDIITNFNANRTSERYYIVCKLLCLWMPVGDLYSAGQWKGNT